MGDALFDNTNLKMPETKKPISLRLDQDVVEQNRIQQKPLFTLQIQ
jgi:uncharacterized protein (DUF4415 family)